MRNTLIKIHEDCQVAQDLLLLQHPPPVGHDPRLVRASDERLRPSRPASQLSWVGHLNFADTSLSEWNADE